MILVMLQGVIQREPLSSLLVHRVLLLREETKPKNLSSTSSRYSLLIRNRTDRKDGIIIHEKKKKSRETSPSPGNTAERRWIWPDLWRFVRRLAGLHGFLVVGLPTEAHLEGWRLSILLQLSHHRDLREVVEGRLDTRRRQ